MLLLPTSSQSCWGAWPRSNHGRFHSWVLRCSDHAYYLSSLHVQSRQRKRHVANAAIKCNSTSEENYIYFSAEHCVCVSIAWFFVSACIFIHHIFPAKGDTPNNATGDKQRGYRWPKYHVVKWNHFELKWTRRRRCYEQCQINLRVGG